MRPAIIIFAALALAGCGGNQTEAPIKTQIVNVAVPVACVPADTPTKPSVPTPTAASLKAAPDAAARYQMLAAWWAATADSYNLAWSVLETCRAAAPAPAKP